MQRQTKIHNILAGTFLISALVIAVVLAFVFSGYSFDRTTSYIVRFPLDIGSAGLQPGSVVTLGGRSVGQVASLEFGSGRPDGAAENIIVHVEILASLVLYDNADAFLVRPLMGTISTINIASPGDPTSGTLLGEHGSIVGGLAPPRFLTEAGFGPKQQGQVATILTQLEEGSTRLNSLVKPFESRSEELARLAEESLDNINDASRNLRFRLDDWSRALDNVVSDIEWFSGELQPLVLRARDGVDEASRLFSRGNLFLDENKASIETSMATMERVLADIEDNAVPQYTALATDARQRIADLDPVIHEFDRFLRAELVPSLRRILANAAVSSGFLKHAIAEIRDQPWRLLIRPTEKELDKQLVYDAARTYAGAVSELRSVSEALSISLGTPGVDADHLQEMATRLDEAFARYEQAERELLDRLVRDDE